MKTKALPYISSIILVLCLLLVLTGSPILNIPVIKESTFPLGTLISWIGLIALTSTIYFGFNKIVQSNSSNPKIYRFAFISIIILAAFWGLIGFLLAKNWAFTFQNHDEFRGGIQASLYFWMYSASLVLFPILLILIFLLMLLAKKLLKKIKSDT